MKPNDSTQDSAVGPILPHAITPEARLAQEFLATLHNPRESWAQPFEVWADAEALGSELRREVKITVLRIRMFSAVARHAKRAARAHR